MSKIVWVWKNVGTDEIYPRSSANTVEELFEASGFKPINCDLPHVGFIAVQARKINGKFEEVK